MIDHFFLFWAVRISLEADEIGQAVTFDEEYLHIRQLLISILIDFGYDGFLTKVEDNGQTLWLEAFGGANPEAIYDLAETPDGGFILVGSTESYGSMLKDAFVIKVDQNGVLEWTNTYGGNDLDEGKSVYIGEDGLLYLIGYTRSFGFGEADIWLIVIDAQGNELNSYTFGTELNNYGVGIISDGSGHLIILSNDEITSKRIELSLTSLLIGPA